MKPRQFGPSHRACRARGRCARSRSCSARPSAPASAKPAAKTTTRADAARRAALDRVEDAGARDRQHRAIDALRQVGGGRQARPPVDLLAVGVDQMDVAGETEALEIAEHGGAERARRRRDAPTIATERGRSRRSIADRPGRAIAFSHRAGSRRARAGSSSRRGTASGPCSRPPSGSRKRACSFFAIR